MAVFTPVSPEEAQEILQDYDLGEFVSMQGITAGIENTNYFLITSKGEYVLTIFEVLTKEQIPFYLDLMYGLGVKKQAVPMPQKRNDGTIWGLFGDKPMCIVVRLNGGWEAHPSAKHCEIVARAQARQHIAAYDLPLNQPNLRGLSWWQETYPKIKPFLNEELQNLYEKSLAEQVEVQNDYAWRQMPGGPCHCDLFRDNVLFDGTYEHPSLGGVIDFYFAGVDRWLFDVAVAVNDWCIDRESGELIPELVEAWLNSYHKGRPFTDAERELWPVALRAAALRFWTSRLYDYYLPRPAQSLKPHDPTHFERILKARTYGDIPPLPAR